MNEMVDTLPSLITAIVLGVQTIVNSIYFENQIARIARQIVELEECDILQEIADLDVAISCLQQVSKTSMMLSDEEKGVIKQAVKRLRGSKCSCTIV